MLIKPNTQSYLQFPVKQWWRGREADGHASAPSPAAGRLGLAAPGAPPQQQQQQRKQFFLRDAPPPPRRQQRLGLARPRPLRVVGAAHPPDGRRRPRRGSADPGRLLGRGPPGAARNSPAGSSRRGRGAGQVHTQGPPRQRGVPRRQVRRRHRYQGEYEFLNKLSNIWGGRVACRLF